MTAAKKSEVATIEPPQLPAALTPMEMVQHAIERGASVEVIGRMMDFQERWDRMQARKAFDAAMSAAKAEIPVIIKNREVDFTSAKGRTNYRHEDMAGIAKIVDPILSRHGLSYRYRATSSPNEPISVTCIISHRDGHSEETTLQAGRDESGNKNSIQAVGSTITYLQRYSLKAALGLAASDDDDGKQADAVDCITEEQVIALRETLEANSKNLAKFLKWAKVEKLDDIPAANYQACIDAANFKRAQ